MNKFLFTILFLVVISWSCDTADSIKPLNEDFFVKMYDGIRPGDQEGVDIIETSDGGLLIAATADSLGLLRELLLIKTDSRGNEEWTYSAATDLGAGANSEAKSVTELADGYLVGGNVIVGSLKRSVLIKVSFSGDYLQSVIINTDRGGISYENTLSKVSVGYSGILICGQTRHPTNDNVGGTNGYVTLYDPGSLVPDPSLLEGIIYFGLDGEDLVAGGFEVMDTVNNIGNQATRFLVFGSTDRGVSGDPKKFFYLGYQRYFPDPVPSMDAGLVQSTLDGDQTVSAVARFGDNYWVVGTKQDGNEDIIAVGWTFSGSGIGNDWKDNGGYIAANNANLEGKGVAIQREDRIIVAGNINYPNNSEVYLTKINGVVSEIFSAPQTYGTATSSYKAGAVTVLQDGSIVLVGTADLQPVKKIVVIKTGPDGEMSF